MDASSVARSKAASSQPLSGVLLFELPLPQPLFVAAQGLRQLRRHAASDQPVTG